MQVTMRALLALGCPLGALSATTPVAKVLTMLSDLQAQIIKDGEVVQKEYTEFAEWCEDRSHNLGFEITTGKSDVERLQAAIAEETASTSALTAKVDDLGASLATDEADLKAANSIRTKEAADFNVAEKELVETVDMLVRATSILERQAKGGASMMQLKNAGSLAQAFKVMLQASMIDSRDAAKLTAFVQEVQKGSDAEDDEDPGAPAAAVYTGQSGNIVDVLQDLTEKAESQLAQLRAREVASRHNFEMLKQSLQDEIKFAAADMEDAKKSIAESTEKKATAEGGLRRASKELAADTEVKGSLHQDCLSKASAFEAETQSRGEELRALAEAKKVIEEATGGAALDQVSFVQLAHTSQSLASVTELHRYEAVRLIRDLARKQNSNALMQLASRMAAEMHSGDTFAKIKNLISDMIVKLENEAGADATKKAYCDKELAETFAKKSDKSDEVDRLGTKIEQLASDSARLKQEVAALQSELSKLIRSQAQMDKFRQREKDEFVESKAALEKGLAGIKGALKILTAYYAQEGKSHVASDGASSGIVSLLEVIEADFSKNLAQTTADEEMAASQHEKVSRENELQKTLKEQDVKYKSKESTGLDKTSAELTNDRNGVQAELDAVLEYQTQIEAECIAKAETYGARKERRVAEIAGLKEALQILESETAFVQRSRKTLRGSSTGMLKASA